MTDTWDGRERRADDARFVKAMSDVRELKVATTDLADAVKIKTDSLHQVINRMAMMLVALFVALIIASFLFFSTFRHSLAAGHKEILCKMELTAEQKAALGALACKE